MSKRWQVAYIVPGESYEVALERVRAYTDTLPAVIQEADPVPDGWAFTEEHWPEFVADSEAHRANAG